MSVPEPSQAENSPRRSQVSKRLRYEILRRDNHACRYCGATAPEAKLTVDHVVPVALGGGDDPSNLVAACVDCNAGKSASSPDAPLVEDVASDAVRWSRAMAAAANVAQAQYEELRAYRREFAEEWQDWRIGWKNEPPPVPPTWAASVGRFHEVGLPVWAMRESIQIAMSAKIRPDNIFRYFCGVAWAKVREIQSAASDLLAIDEGDV